MVENSFYIHHSLFIHIEMQIPIPILAISSPKLCTNSWFMFVYDEMCYLTTKIKDT